jgi:excisionase family DNA binding protein
VWSAPTALVHRPGHGARVALRAEALADPVLEPADHLRHPVSRLGRRGSGPGGASRPDAAASGRASKVIGGKLNRPSGREVSGVDARFLLLSDVAAELNVSDSQVYHMVRSGELPAIKVGGRGQWRVERARLEAYIEQKYAETAEWVRSNPLIDRDEP